MVSPAAPAFLNLDELLSTRGRNAPAAAITDPRASAQTSPSSTAFRTPPRSPTRRSRRPPRAPSSATATGRCNTARPPASPSWRTCSWPNSAATKGSSPRPDNLMITAGGSQALQLVLDLLVDQGDTVIAEAPTWMGFIDALAQRRRQPRHGPARRRGDRHRRARGGAAAPPRARDDAEAHLRHLQLPEPERHLDHGRRAGKRLVDARGRVRHARPRRRRLPRPPLRRRAHPADLHARRRAAATMYLGTLSKIMGAGMRIGWLVAPEPLIRLSRPAQDRRRHQHLRLVRRRRVDPRPPRRATSTRLNAIYAERRDLMLAALERSHAGGFDLDDARRRLLHLVDASASRSTPARILPQARERGVEYLPGSTCYTDGRGKNQIRLSFSFAENDQHRRRHPHPRRARGGRVAGGRRPLDFPLAPDRCPRR